MVRELRYRLALACSTTSPPRVKYSRACLRRAVTNVACAARPRAPKGNSLQSCMTHLPSATSTPTVAPPPWNEHGSTAPSSPREKNMSILHAFGNTDNPSPVSAAASRVSACCLADAQAWVVCNTCSNNIACPAPRLASLPPAVIIATTPRTTPAMLVHEKTVVPSPPCYETVVRYQMVVT